MTTTDPAPPSALSDRELDIALANLIEQMRHDHPILYHADGACRHTSCFRCESSAPHYSTDHAAAAEALDALVTARWDVHIEHIAGQGWLGDAEKSGYDRIIGYSRVATMPRAVAECAALALAAMREDA